MNKTATLFHLDRHSFPNSASDSENIQTDTTFRTALGIECLSGCFSNVPIKIETPISALSKPSSQAAFKINLT